MTHYEIFYIDKEMGCEVCFKHAVQAASIENKVIETEVEEQDPGESGINRIHSCYMCEE